MRRLSHEAFRIFCSAQGIGADDPDVLSRHITQALGELRERFHCAFMGFFRNILVLVEPGSQSDRHPELVDDAYRIAIGGGNDHVKAVGA